MRYAIFFIIVVIAIVNLPSEVWAEDMHMQHEKSMKEDVSEASEEEIEDVGNAICPVMGGKVDKDVSYVYDGKRYYFCCPMCIEGFIKDPEKYIKQIEKEEEKVEQEQISETQ